MASGIRRWLYRLAGILCVGLAVLGVALPVLPTTPFLLLASFCFVRSSPRLHRWLLRQPVFGAMIRDWEHHRGVRRSTKFVAVSTILVVIGSTLLFAKLKMPLPIVLGVLGSIGLVTVIRLPIVERSQGEPFNDDTSEPLPPP